MAVILVYVFQANIEAAFFTLISTQWLDVTRAPFSPQFLVPDSDASVVPFASYDFVHIFCLSMSMENPDFQHFFSQRLAK